MSRWKRSSKRRVKARLRIGRWVSMAALIYHDLDFGLSAPEYEIDWHNDVVRRGAAK